MTIADINQFSVGDRIEDSKDGQRGTVRFVGEVPPTKGLWLGIEWDHPEVRGKHDGTHEGVKYFETLNRTSPNSASFVRPAKVSRGIALCEAVAERYGLVEGSTAGVDERELERLCKEIGAPFVTVVGFDKVNKQQSNFAKLRTVSLRRCAVSNLGPNPDLIGTTLERVQNLDLGENLFNSWVMLADIGRRLKHLKVLTVSDNKLSIPESPDSIITEAFVKLEQLIIGNMDYDWSQIFTITSGLSNLQLLDCHSNRIAQIPDFRSSNAFTNLIELNLNSNPLNDWSNVLKFAHLKNLRTVYINGCGIKSIWFEPDSNEEDCFPALRCLCMTYNEISDWKSFFNLDRLKISDLRCRNNPIVENEPVGTSRQMLIATISSLVNLNGTEIFRTERYGADIDYLKRYGLEYLAAVKDNKLAEFSQNHPRYLYQVAKYGAIEEEELKKKDTSLRSTLLEVTISCPDVENFEKLSKKLPQTMTIQKLRLLIQRLLNQKKLSGVTAHKLVMLVSSAKQPEVQVPLDNDMRDLFFYSVDNGDTIFVKW